ncbi:MAG: PQQ-binding-like beta-propeller repeat protein [Dokdonella sp.]
MQYRNALFGFALAAVSMMVTSVAPQARASEIWRNDWIVQAPATLITYTPQPSPRKPMAAFAFGANGDVLFDAFNLRYSYPDETFVRLGNSGALRWSSHADLVAYAALVEDGGDAFLALGVRDSGDFADRVTHVAANGSIAWSRGLPTGWLAKAGSGRLASLGCNSLTMLDADSGDVLWERVFAADRSDNCHGNVVADDQGNLYVELGIGNYDIGVISNFRTLKFAADGTELWSVAEVDNGGSLIGVGGAALYLRTATGVRALRIADGGPIWSASLDATANVLLGSGDPVEPMVVAPDFVQRLAFATGAPRWTASLPGLTGVAAVIGDAIVVASSSSFTKLDSASGAVVWTHAAADNAWRGFGAFDGAAFIGVAATSNDGVSALERIDASSGEMTEIAMPSIVQGVDAVSVTDETGDIASAGMSVQGGQTVLRLRKVDTAGATVWETADTIDTLISSPWLISPPSLAMGSGVVAVGTTVSTGFCSAIYGQGYALVTLHDRVTGQLKWSVPLDIDHAQHCAWVSNPSFDTNGDVIVAASAIGACVDFGDTCERQSLYKLAASTGAVLWHVDNIGYQTLNYQIFPQAFSLVGSDVLLHGPFVSSQDTIRRLSGANGEVQWTSGLFHEKYYISDAVYAIDPNHVVVFSGTDTTIDWASLDINTGTASWTSTTPRPVCAPQGCAVGAFDLLPYHGDLLSGGELNFAPSLKRYHNDGSSVADSWVIGPTNPLIYGGITSLWRDPNDLVETFVYEGFKRSQGSLQLLSAFDSTSGALLGKQAIYAGNPDSLAWSYPSPLRAPTADRLLVNMMSSRESMPATTGAALLDTSVTAHGNLAVTLSVDQSSVHAGELLGFHLTATYAGDVPLTGVHAFVLMPWQGGVTATCSGANCVLDTRTGNVDATFDISPGGSVDITGQVRVLDQSVHPTMSARTWGSLGLSEQDVLDNFAQAAVTQTLFADGFDG